MRLNQRLLLHSDLGASHSADRHYQVPESFSGLVGWIKGEAVLRKEILLEDNVASKGTFLFILITCLPPGPLDFCPRN